MNEPTENSRRRAESRSSLEAFNWSAGLRAFYDTICGGGQLIFVSYALALGLAQERMGLITSVVNFACLLQLVSMAVMDFLPDKKSFILRVGAFEPLMLAAVALAAPFLPAGLQIWALGAGVFLAAASFHLTRPLADNWLASSIPVTIRARYLARRWQVISACTIAAMLLAGFTAERIEKSNSFGFGCALAGGGLCGVLSILALRKAPMPEQSAFVRVAWKDALDALRVRPFRNYLAGFFIFNLPFLIACPYYQVFNLRVLHLKGSRIAYMMIGYLLVRLLVTGFAGRFIQRLGVRRAIWASGPVYALFFLAFPFCTPERVWPLFAAWAMVGAADGIFTIAGTVALYDSVPQTPARPIYFAIANVASLGMFCIGGAAAVPILEGLQNVKKLGPFALGQFHCFYAICFVMMLGAMCGAAFFPAREKELT